MSVINLFKPAVDALLLRNCVVHFPAFVGCINIPLSDPYDALPSNSSLCLPIYVSLLFLILNSTQLYLSFSTLPLHLFHFCLFPFSASLRLHALFNFVPYVYHLHCTTYYTFILDVYNVF